MSGVRVEFLGRFTIPRWMEDDKGGDERDVRESIRAALDQLGFGIRDLSVDVWKVPDEEVAA